VKEWCGEVWNGVNCLPYRLFLAAPGSSCEVLPSRWRQRRRNLWFMLSSAAASTTAMPCCTALQMANCSDCNPSRTQLRVWWLEPDAPTTSRRFSSHFIGCQYDNASLSTFKLATLVHKCLNGWAPGYLADDIRLAGRRRPGSRSAALAWCWTSLARRRHWETEHLPSPDRVSGTAFLVSSVIRHCRCQSSENCWKLTCLFKGRGAGDLWTGAFEMYWLTN